jgi:dienelactone hydrolase
MIRPVPFLALFLVCTPAAVARASDACDGLPSDPAHPAGLWREIFTYDAAADLGVQVVSTRTVGRAVITDVTFVTRPQHPAERVAAYIVAPLAPAGAPAAATVPAADLAGVLWVHWLGNPATTNRTEFLDEATALASQGVVSVLVDAMWARPRWYRDRSLDEDYANAVGQVVALRRALDLLAAQPGVDRARIGLVGHDYGGMYGAIAAGVDGRPRTQVVVAATASLLDWAFFYGKQPSSMDRYKREHQALSLCDHLAASERTSVLFQFAERDEYVTAARAQALFAAASGPKQMVVYGRAGHDMIAPPAIRVDRTAWLVRELVLAPRSTP